MALVNKCALR